ncbi:MAG: DUF5777 family beta-barrel protein [Bacteroidota bacterium]
MYQTFRGTRIVNGHSVEVNDQGALTFWISHRFGPLSQGAEGLIGLDQATIRLGLDYGVTDWLMVGLGRSGLQRTYDTFAKARVLRQGREGGWPISVTWLSTAAVSTLNSEGIDFSDRVTYTHQLLIARKFGEAFSLQLMPTLLHRNLAAVDEKNDIYALGIAPRIQLNKMLAITAEYYLHLSDGLATDPADGFSLAVEIDTKGHVFQLSLSNARGMIERFFITETEGSWDSLDNIHLGFNITRDFRIGKRKRY